MREVTMTYVRGEYIQTALGHTLITGITAMYFWKSGKFIWNSIRKTGHLLRGDSCNAIEFENPLH